MSKPIDWQRYPLRTCMTLHACSLCNESILLSQRYYDGGYGRRAHELCVLNQTATAKFNVSLLSGIDALKRPNFHELNVFDSRNDRLLHAVLCAYAKHHLDSDEIGWDKLGEILHDAICNEIGDENYCAWAEKIKTP